MKITVFMASSLDGFIADENGGVGWLNDLSTPNDSKEDFGYSALIESVDRLVMGRTSFNQVLGFGSWPYGALPVTVLTHQALPENIPAEAMLSFAQGSPDALVNQFTSEGDQHIYIDGASVVQQFLEAGLVDEIILTQVPALLGRGISLFKEPLDQEVWQVQRVRTYPNGFVQTQLSK